MSNIAIHVENLSKQFRIGAIKNNRNFREALIDGFKAPFQRAGRVLRGQVAGPADLDETIWALKDVSFEIKDGELVGIIGRNGAGKSTLLKILCRITEPTQGFADVQGRVGSLLEVGTGFHPELTGRENIYLNGAILGMKRVEINRKFDEIVAFAEVEKFIDTPVKHYSSGMYLRLAFAVAAHLEPEILIVDEVLAVGDARFQKKCLNKMQDIGQKGHTVLFVSHNMGAVVSLCKRAILFNDGRILMDGDAHEVVNEYTKEGVGLRHYKKWDKRETAPGDDVVRLLSVRLKNENGDSNESIDVRDSIAIEMEFEVYKSGHWLLPNINVFNENGLWLFTSFDLDPEWRRRPRPEGYYKSTCHIPENIFSAGIHTIEPAMMTPEPFVRRFREPEAIGFLVIDNMEGNSARGDWTGFMGGVMRPFLKWTTHFREWKVNKEEGVK